MDLSLSQQERLDLSRLLQTSDATNNTEHIRQIKHSSQIFDNMLNMQKIKKSYLGKMSPEDDASKKDKCINECSFLYNNYTDIFNKIYNDELDLNIFARLLFVLKYIEDGKLDQHEGGVIVGKLLKELYIDSALRKGQQLDEKYGTGDSSSAEKITSRDVSWTDWKRKLEYMKRGGNSSSSII